MLNTMQRNALVTIMPAFENVPDNITRFHWRMHVSLPYPFPSKECVKQEVRVLEKRFAFQIHNHFNRAIHTLGRPGSGPVYFRVVLEDKRQPYQPQPGEISSRKALQSVVIFEDLTDYSSPNEAFDGADSRIRACFEYLAAFLSACQRAAPYQTAWLVYPVSHFDVGTVYHEALAHCSTHNHWNVYASTVAISMGRHLQRPAFVMEVPSQTAPDTLIDAANELLAEALMSLFRGMPRLTVLNAYTAVESLANAVFSKTKVAQLVAVNVPRHIAEELVEEERKHQRTDPKFLFNRGIKSAAGRSLMEENKARYDALLDIQDLRHQVAHTGFRPSLDKAREAHQTCCEVAQWLAEIGGFPVKPMLPDADVTSPGFGIAMKDAHAQNLAEFEFVRHLLGLELKPRDPNP